MDREDNPSEANGTKAYEKSLLNYETGIDLNSGIDCESNEIVDLEKTDVRKQLVPVLGMEFETEEDAFEFYNAYAYTVGFSVRKSKAHKNDDGKLMDRLFVCSSEGHRQKKKCDPNVEYHRAETRFGCQARMQISCGRSAKNYKIIKFIPEHTHPTSSPSKTHFFRSHRNMSFAQKVEADMADSSGIAPRESVEFMSRQAGGRQNLGFIYDDYKNYLCSKRTREMKLGDTGGVLEYLQKMQLNDPNFFYAIQVDEDDLITNIFWADSRMMVDYDYFGDVVCFDTTYRKNKEGRPFAMFVGVNNHKQTVVFGAALLYAETAATFSWLFDTFVKAMSGKKPKTILTDQDAAMAKALFEKWPQTCHRLCIWHIYQNAAKQLKSVFENFNDFAKEFSSCIYDHEDEDDFLYAWNNMLQKYNLTDDDWLNRLFAIKEKWALVYGRQNFCADITTTQRSESMNSAIKKYVNYKYDLLRFVKHFERLVDDRRYQELRAEFKASQSSPALSFPVEILKHAAGIYTPAVLKWFQNELCKAHDCVLIFNGETESISKYEIIPHRKNWHHTVTFDSTNNTVLCSCKKYDFAGILCAHALKVLSTRNITSIPTQYVLERWTKNIKSRSVRVTLNISSKDDPKANIVRRYKELCRLHIQLATRAAESPEAYEIAISRLNKTLGEVDACLKEKATQRPTQVSASELSETICIDDNVIRVRGIKTKKKVAGSSKRPRNALEKAAKKKKSRNKELKYSTVDFIAGSTQTALPHTPILQSVGQPNLMPGHMHFGQPFDSSQQYNIGIQNPASSYLQGPTSMVNLLQAQIQLPTNEGIGFDKLSNDKHHEDT